MLFKQTSALAVVVILSVDLAHALVLPSKDVLVKSGETMEMRYTRLRRYLTEANAQPGTSKCALNNLQCGGVVTQV